MKILKFFGLISIATVVAACTFPTTIIDYPEACAMRMFVTDSTRDPNNPDQWIYGDTIWLGDWVYSDNPFCPINQQIGG